MPRKHFDQTLFRFYTIMGAAVIFVGLTSRALPNIVASHFNSKGQVDGLMPRAIYIGFIYAMVVLAPLFLALFPRRTFRDSRARLNIPNRAYWLAPIRREATIAFLLKQPPRFATLVLLFLCYVHVLVVKANQLPIPVLSTRALLIGFIVFLSATLLWIVIFFAHLWRVPDD